MRPTEASRKRLQKKYIPPDNGGFRGAARGGRPRGFGSRPGADDEVTRLGSIATDKNLSVLTDVLGPRLSSPREFVGRGDVSWRRPE